VPVDLILWIVLAVVVLVGAVSAVVVVRRRQALTRSHRVELPPAAPTPPRPGADVAPAPVVETEAPEEAGTRLARLRRRLSGSTNVLAQALLGIISSDKLDADTWDDFEATLIGSDLGVGPTGELVENLRRELSIDGVADPERARAVLRRELVALTDPSLDRDLDLDSADGLPAVVLVVGVNGTGKTTTVGKLARLLVAEGRLSCWERPTRSARQPRSSCRHGGTASASRLSGARRAPTRRPWPTKRSARASKRGWMWC
jgi:fused signal recognition particle receptor